MPSSVAFSAPVLLNAPATRGIYTGRNRRTICMVAPSKRSGAAEEAARNARLGIANLWDDPPPVPSIEMELESNLNLPSPVPNPYLALPAADGTTSITSSADVPVVGEDDGRPVLPWDTTTGVQGMSYLTRRMRFLTRRRISLKKSYRECERITELFSKTFYMGCSLLSPEKRKATYAIYTWCRRTDDLVDGPRVQQRSAGLSGILRNWSSRLDDIFDSRLARDHLDLALVDTIEKFPHLTPRPFHDMIAGMVMDVEMDRFETFDQLYLYCYRVAGTVGLMTLPIIGAATPGREGLRNASDAALSLGIALQLTNILRDVGEDRLRGRIYLPLEDLRRFRYTEEDLQKCVLDDRYRALMKFQIKRARKYFKRAEKGIPLLAEDARLPVRASLDMYSQILDVLEQNGYDNFSKRAYLSKMGKLATVPISWMRCQDESGWDMVADFLDKFRGRKSLS